jgi:hypothetical protein
MTRTWTEGYQRGEYLHAYHAELNPLRLTLHFLNAGLAPPTTVTAACELGFGQGVSMNLHAAASSITWFGTDFNAAQTAFARETAIASGAEAHFFDESFAAFCARADLPDFDFIGMHGVWSWVNDANHEVIVDFLRRKLNVGGVLYVSYNTPPGDAAFTAMQEVFTRYAEAQGMTGLGLPSRMNAALDFAEKLVAVSPAYAQANPDIGRRLGVIRTEDPTYVAHEYANRDWIPTSVSRMAEWLAPAKLDYACSARFFDTVDQWNLNTEQQAVLTGIPDPMFRETVRDFMMNRRFRKDYWVKGARTLTTAEKAEGIRRQRVVLICPRPLVNVKGEGTLGRFTPPAGVSEAILELLADHRPHSILQIERGVKDQGIGLLKILEVLMTLMESSALSTVQDDSITRSARKQTDKLNAHLSDKALTRVTQGVFASPVTGGALVYEERLLHLFWHAMSKGRKQPAELAAHAAQLLNTEGAQIPDRETPPSSTPGRDTPAFLQQAAFFIDKIAPMFKALQVL